MSGRVSIAATLLACVMLALLGIRDDSGLLVPAGVLALVGLLAAGRHRAIQDAATLRAYRLRRIQIGRDRLYVSTEEDDDE